MSVSGLSGAYVLLAWELLCICLLFSVFCRLVHTTVDTRLDVRLSIYALGLASLLGIGAPLYGWLPDVVALAMTTATLAMQVVAARHWRHGVPASFQVGDSP